MPLQVRRMTYRILIEKEGILDMLRCSAVAPLPEVQIFRTLGTMPPLPPAPAPAKQVQAACLDVGSLCCTVSGMTSCLTAH